MKRKTFSHLSLSILIAFPLLFSVLVNGYADGWKTVSAGGSHTLAVKADGSLWTWGYNSSGQLGTGSTTTRTLPTHIGKDSDWVAVSAGGSHSVALKANGTLWAWGNNADGQLGIVSTTIITTPTLIGRVSNWTAISAGGRHTIALRSDGTLWAWGYGVTTPTQIGTGTNWTAISAGGNHAVALRSGGTLYAWGQNDFGQLGDGTTIDQTLPKQIGADSNWTAIAAGGYHTIALKADGTLWTWGRNNYSQLGDNTTTQRNSPIQIGRDNDWTAVSAGDYHSTAVKSDGTLWVWGYNASGQLGIDSTAIKAIPFQMKLSRVVAISAGGSHTLAVLSEGALLAWGNNSYGQLGNGTRDPLNPDQVGSSVISADACKIEGGSNHTIILKSNGSLWAMGYNGFGQLGDATIENKSFPTQVGTETRWSAMTAGFYHTVGIKAYGTLWSWGRNNFGQLGDGTATTTSTTSSSQIGTDNTWVAVSAGTYHTVALKADGTLWAWGYNAYGQLGDGTTTQRPSPIQIGTDKTWVAVSAGAYHTMALKADGTLWAWGYNYYSQLGDDTTINRTIPTQIGTGRTWISIATGTYYTIALKADGTLWAWGSNVYGQLGDGTTTSKTVPTQIGTDYRWVAISAGGYHTIALKANGTLWAWGYNAYGQLGDGSTTQQNLPTQIGTDDSWEAVSAGTNHTVALKADGTLWTWGYNAYGQLGDGTTTNESVPIKCDITPPTGSLSINGGIGYTNSASVTLTLSASDENGVSQMSFSNDNVTWSDPETYSASRSWALSSGDGTKIVYVKFKDSRENWSTALYDTIVLDTTPPAGVTAGANVTRNAEFTQTGTATDANGMTYSWGTQAGPGTVIFGAANAISTTLSASVDGTYTIRFTATDAAGNSSSSDMILTWDTASPTVAIGSPSTTITNSGPVSYTVTYAGADTVTLTAADVTLIATGTANGTVTVSDTGTTTRTATISGITGEGTLSISIAAGTASDAAGNLSAASGTSASFMVDKTAPVVSAGSNQAKGTAFTQTGTATDANAMTYSWTQQSGPGTVTFGTPNAAATTISASVDGVYTIRFTATDAAGNGSSSDMTLTWKSTEPSAIIGPPSVTMTKGGPVTYAVTYTGADAVSLTAANVNLITTGTANGTVAVSGAGNTTRTVTLSGITGDGTLGISIAAGTASDVVGNTAPASGASETFMVDNTAPTASAGGNQIRRTVFTQVGAATDANGMTYGWSKQAGPGAVTFGSPTGLSTTVAASADGTYTIRFTATDAAGNSSSSDLTLIWDTAAPTLAIGGPSSAMTKSSPVTYTVTYTGADNVTLADAQVTLNKTGTANGTVIVSGTGNATRSATISGITGDGTLGISIAAGTASDAAGNLAAASGASETFTVDNTVPAVSAGSNQAKGASFTQLGTATDANAMTYSWTRQSGPGTVAFGSPNAILTEISASVDGTYTIRFTSTDAAGNSSSSDMTLLWDTAAPTAAIGSPSNTMTKDGPVTYAVTYTGADAVTLTAADVSLIATGTANGTVAVSGTDNTTRTATISGITGDGTLGISIAAGTASDGVGNLAPASGASEIFTVDNTAPAVSAGSNQARRAVFTQVGAATDANGMTYGWSQQAGPGTVTFGSPTDLSTTVAASTDGTYTIRLTATDAAGNSASSDMTLLWDTAAPTASIDAPSATIGNSGPVTYTVTYAGADAISLANAHLTLNKTGTANGTVSVSGTGNSTRTVTISNITGDGTLGISISAETAGDAAGNLAGPAGPSTTLTVDNIPATTTANPKGGAFNSAQNVSLTTSETAAIYFTTNGNDPTLSSSIYNPASGISIAATTNLKFRALDPAGNLESVKTETYTIAKVGPAGLISGPALIKTRDVTVSLTAIDIITHMKFSLNEMSWSDEEPFANQRTFSLASDWQTDGVKNIYVKFRNSENIWSNKYTYTTTLDTTKPTGSVAVAGGALGTTSQTISLTLGAADSTSGVQQVGLSNDGQNYIWGNYLPGQPIDWILTAGEGQKTVYVKFRDAAGNESDPYSVQITFDTAKPVPVISSPVNGSSVTALNFIKGSVTDASPSSGIAKIEIRLTDGSRFIKANGDWTTTDTFFALTPSEINGDDWNHTTLFLDWVLDKTYTITVRATDYAGNSADTTLIATFVAPEKAYTTLSLWPTSQTIIGGGTLDVSGTLDRPGAIINLKDRPIKLTIADPSGIVSQTLNTTTYDTAGHYELTGITGFDKKGAWHLTASFNGSASLDSAQSTRTVLVGNTAGYAILIQGKIDDSDSDGIASHNKTANRIYKKLRERGFDAANIRFFNYDTNQEGVYNTPTKADKTNGANPQGIENSIKQWATDRINSAPAPLYIIMVNHGNPGIFHLGSVEKITPTDLASWLNDLENNLNAEALKEKRVIIIGACYSGSFISELSKPRMSGAPNRIVIASAADDEESYRGANEPDGIRSGEYFLEEFFIQLGRGYSLKRSFDVASQKTEEYTRKGGTHANTTSKYFDHSVQHPLLEDDGNLVGSNKLSEGQGDGTTAANLFFGAGATYTNSANNPAEIVKVTDTVYLDSDPSHISAPLTLQTNVDTYGVDNAWVEIRSPNKTLTPSGSGSMQLVIDLAKAPMASIDPNGHWAVTYNGFTESGMYDILYFVRDKQTGKISPMKRSVVYKDRAGNTAPCGATGCPSQFHLLSPASNSTQKTTLVFTWDGAVDSDGVTYNLVIAEDINFTKVVYRKEGIAATMTHVDNAAGLKDPMTYYWMIEAVDGFGGKTTSYEKWPFKTDNTNGYPGIITGIVYSDRDFSMITSATITAMINGNAIPIAVKDGLFILSANAAAIDITGASSGYQTTALADIPVKAGEATVVNLSLSPVAGQITATAGQNGTISCTPNPVNYGNSSTCTVSPAAGYQMDTFTVDGSPATLTNDQYVFSNVTANHTVNVTFKPLVAYGDINNDGSVDLDDAILVLQVISKIPPPPSVSIPIQADVNGDGRIDLPEVIYILQKAAGLR